jgi:hypothetical protein
MGYDLALRTDDMPNETRMILRQAVKRPALDAAAAKVGSHFVEGFADVPPLPASGCTRARLQAIADQPQFQIGPIGVRVQQGPKLPPLKRPP